MSVMVITGGSRGIGAATARLAAEAGWDVCISYATNEAAAAEVVESCTSQGVSATAVQADVSVEADVQKMFAAAQALGPIGCLINNAGILHQMSTVADYTVERLHEVVNVNVVGAFLCARDAVRAMSTERGGQGGTIVNVSSAASYLGSANEFVDYAATKGAIDTMTIGLAREVAREGIRVNAVRPGLIDTEIHASAGVPDRVALLQDNIPMGRGGTADEVASTILWLASPDSGYVTGALLNVSGGR